MKQAINQEYPQTWYPILIAKKLKRHAIQQISAFGGDWILFRGRSGVTSVVNRYCCHMGVDLAQAKIVGDSIECPLHGWRFNTKGQCHHIPALAQQSDARLKGKVLKTLPTQEMYGIIFVFYGEIPNFDIPQPPHMTSLSYSHCKTFILETEFHVPSLNTFDLQHYQSIHNRKLIESPAIHSKHLSHLGIQMHAEVVPKTIIDKVIKRLTDGQEKISIDCWGGSLLLMNNDKTGYGAVISMLPIEENKTRLFLVAVKKVSQKTSAFKRLGARLSLMLAAQLIKGFITQDEKVLSGMKPTKGTLIEGLDDAVVRYWNFYNALPRNSHQRVEKEDVSL